MCKRGEVGRLTLVQAAAYEQKGEVPDCRFHAHCKIAEAHALVDAMRDEKNNLIEGYGSARWVGDQFRYICDVPHKISQPYLVGHSCGDGDPPPMRRP